jgi:hypothetical protein
VKSVKIALKSSLGNRKVSYEVFRTVVAQAEGVVNSRPLTMVSNDVGDLIPITPAMLMFQRDIMQLPDHLARDDKTSKIAVMWKERARLHTEFWTRWSTEYIASLQVASKWTVPGREPKVGEIVLLKDQTKTRSEWPLARIVEAYPGRGGKIRTVKLFTHAGNEPLTRDIRFICRLEDSVKEMDEHDLLAAANGD